MEKKEKQDNQEKNTTKSFLFKRKQEMATVVALIIFHFLTGLSLWLIAVVALYLIANSIMANKPANLKTLAKVLNVVIAIFLIYIAIEQIMPRVHEKRENVIDKIDQTFSQFMPTKNEIRTADIFEEERKKAVEDFRPYYRQLLNEGRVEEAADTLFKFEEYWNLRIQLKKAKINNVQKADKALSENKKSIKQSSPKKLVGVKDSIFYPGTYEIEVDNITDFYIIPMNNKKYQYFTIDSSDKEYKLIFKNGNIYNADSQIREKNLAFRLIATGDRKEKITMTIS